MIVSEKDIIAKIYDDNLNDIKNGVYGKVIEDKGDGTYVIDDNIRHVDMKIEGNDVVFCNTYTTYPCEWIKALPIISIEDLRYEQLYFKNETEMTIVDTIFFAPSYMKVTKNKTAEIVYMSPMEYMELCAIGFDSTLSRQIKQTNKETIKQYANDILKGDLFPLISITQYEDGSINQEGRHRAMAIQYLIDNNEIPEDTEIPVVIVTEA